VYQGIKNGGTPNQHISSKDERINGKRRADTEADEEDEV
jgi:hypothetical protein